ncbi:MAG: hypothetical protein FRX49_03747 [Trebouxia sp. A1-2]|nr:MAG: hypothetical protein FRX49_03747 [Trebouxia sp. A1-2]
MAKRSLCIKAGSGKVIAAQMIDSSALLLSGQVEAAQQRLAKDGYLLLRGYLPTAKGTGVAGVHGLGMLQRQDLAAAIPVQQVLEAPELFHLMECLLQVPDVITTGYKWLRAVCKGEFTGVHTDKVFLGRGSPRVLTAWVPLGQVNIEDGAMMVCRGSHRMRSFAKLKAGYGQTQVGKDGTQSGWYSDNGADLAHMISPHAVDWRSTDFQPGDIVVLGMEVVHMTACNVSGQIRLSCDTRWQPAGDARDPRLSVWHSKS